MRGGRRPGRDGEGAWIDVVDPRVVLVVVPNHEVFSRRRYGQVVDIGDIAEARTVGATIGGHVVSRPHAPRRGIHLDDYDLLSGRIGDRRVLPVPGGTLRLALGARKRKRPETCLDARRHIEPTQSIAVDVDAFVRVRRIGVPPVISQTVVAALAVPRNVGLAVQVENARRAPRFVLDRVERAVRVPRRVRVVVMADIRPERAGNRSGARSRVSSDPRHRGPEGRVDGRHEILRLGCLGRGEHGGRVRDVRVTSVVQRCCGERVGCAKAPNEQEAGSEMPGVITREPHSSFFQCP